MVDLSLMDQLKGVAVSRKIAVKHDKWFREIMDKIAVSYKEHVMVCTGCPEEVEHGNGQS